MSRPLIGIIGTGRVGSALAIALVEAGYQVGPVCSRDGVSAVRLAACLPSVIAVPTAQTVADSADLVIIATPDRVIDRVCTETRWRAGMSVVHTSGGTPVAALYAAVEQGADIGGWHPLKSFAGGPADAELLDITFAIEASGTLRDTLSDMTAALGGRSLLLDAAHRTRYHASAALASNGLVALMSDAASLWTEFDWSRAEALRALLPLVRGTVENMESLGLPAALTGPVERGDAATVQAHLDSLSESSPAVVETYRQLSRRALALAVEKGAMGENEATALAALLNGCTCGVVVK